MPKKSKQELLENLQKQQEALKNKISSVQAKVRNEEEKKLTRMKILAGAYLLEQYKDKMDKLSVMLDGFLTRDNDRSLFKLPHKKINNKQSENAEVA